MSSHASEGLRLPPPSPDFERLRTVLLRRGEPDRVPQIELFADREIMEAVISQPIPVPAVNEYEERQVALDRVIHFWHLTGYDYITATTMTELPHDRVLVPASGAPSAGRRAWVDESKGVINSWQDLEQYPWPKAEDIDYFNLEYLSKRLPEGMKLIFMGPGGQLENIMWLMGYVPFAIALKTDPSLVEAVAERIGQFLVSVYSTAIQFPDVAAVWLGDDMGFKTSTLISPADLRRYAFPWQKKLVQIAHERGKPFLLHSCGNLRTIMEELIEDIGIDAKHSFEDGIMPAVDAKRQYGDRIAILGGVDVDFLCRATEEEVRAYTRRIIGDCAPGGGWALGTGNSVTNYIPLENYLAMLDEGRQCGRYR